MLALVSSLSVSSVSPEWFSTDNLGRELINSDLIKVNLTQLNSHKCSEKGSTHSACGLWTHSSLWSDRKLRRSLKNSSERSTNVSSASRTPEMKRENQIYWIMHRVCVWKRCTERDQCTCYPVISKQGLQMMPVRHRGLHTFVRCDWAQILTLEKRILKRISC